MADPINAADPRAVLAHYFRWVSEACQRAADAFPHDKRELRLQDDMRSPLEIIQHLIGGNHVMIQGLRDQTELSAEDRKAIEVKFETYDEALAELKLSSGELASALESLDPQLLIKDGELDMNPGSWLQRLQIASVHHAYHWGQFNYIHTSYGDDVMH